MWGICFCGDETSPSSSLRSMPPPLVGEALAFRDVFQQTSINLSKTKPLCQGLSCQESCRADARLRGWTKDAFRVSGITQVLLCTTSPTSSLRSMPPPLVGEALAFRDVFQQTQIGFIENDTSLPRAPLPGELASDSETERLDKGRLSSERNNAGAALYNFSVIFAHARCHLSCQERLWHSVAFSSKTKSVSSKTKPLCQGLPCQGSCRADARLRGWTKDAFRVSGITQVLLCTTSPSSSLTLDATSPSRGGFGIP